MYECDFWNQLISGDKGDTGASGRPGDEGPPGPPGKRGQVIKKSSKSDLFSR